MMIKEEKLLEFIRATAEDLEDYMKAKIDAFSDDLSMYGFGPTGYDDYDKELENIEQYPTYKIVLEIAYATQKLSKSSFL